MSEYNAIEFLRIEKKWQKKWQELDVYKTTEDNSKEKFYVLDMFPYPSGAGLHVGHPLGYIASDIFARYKRLKGFNVLHPIGFDAFGLPAEQYAIEHGIHPSVSTQKNIETFKKQLSRIGFSFDWSREVQTCDPKFYKWTQWLFLKIFDSWFNRIKEKAEPISELIIIFEKEGNKAHPYPNSKHLEPDLPIQFTKEDWVAFNERQQQQILMQYRLAYLAHTEVNWCEQLGTVLANDEVINGVSYRGGFPVVKKRMRQWNLRITEYAERLLSGLNKVDFSDSMKDIQINWIGKSIGAKIDFPIVSETKIDEYLSVFTTRPDTIFGVDFMVVAPELELVKSITSKSQKAEVEKYLKYVAQRAEIDRMADVNQITGCFTGAYAINPVSEKRIPIWISEYVLAGYGTGAIMAVPCGDERDHKFAKHFNLPITNIIGEHYNGAEANDTDTAILENSGFLNGIKMKDAYPLIINYLEENKLGQRQINYKMRDAGWSRQRYWGEPFPVVFRNDVPYPVTDASLPLVLPDTNNYKSKGSGEGPLANLKDWINISASEKRDSNTMPTHAGAAWYFLRYMDPHNEFSFADKEKLNYWGQVDVYVGGSEHAVAHLLYSRLWIKIFHDLGYLNFDEPFKKLVNQGKITGNSKFVYRQRGTNTFISHGLISDYNVDALHVDVKLVDGNILDVNSFKNWKPNFKNAEFILENKKYICGEAIEKMSKAYYNVVNPDDIIDRYGADTLRLYEMFLGPLEQSKPWNTNGIEGVYKFLRRFWSLFHGNNSNWSISEGKPSREELKILHKTIRKVAHDIETFSFNTSVSEFMICVNELIALKCNNRNILEPLTILLSPFAPHISEELWEQLGHDTSITYAKYPDFNEDYLVESSFDYPISLNGKVRIKMNLSLDLSSKEIEKQVLASPIVQNWLNGKSPKKVIIVVNKIVNIVL